MMIPEEFPSEVTAVPVFNSLFTNQYSVVSLNAIRRVKQIMTSIILTLKLLFCITESSDILLPAMTQWTQLYPLNGPIL